MKIFKFLFLCLAIVILLFSCSKESASPSAAESNGTLLAGTKGASKSWKLASATGSANGGAMQALTLDACFLDNVYTFSNNTVQNYQQVEGLTKCNASDTTIVENGSWAFTLDGKSLLVDGAFYNPNAALFAELGEPVSITKLTATSLVINFTIANGGNSFTYNFTFASN